MALVTNLNELLIENADGPSQALKDCRATTEDGQTTVLFKNLEQELILRIRQADVVVGCIAWLTSNRILRELAKKRGTLLIVQKEDFLRPDLDATTDWPRKLRRLYDALPRTLNRYDWAFHGTSLHGMSYAGDPSIDPVRCVGNLNAKKSSAFPRAHHKFVVFCRLLRAASQTKEDEAQAPSFEPYEVWTGSFNFTKNATYSFENAIVSRDKNIVRAFFQEACQIAALSERLDWETEWTAPQWRIGS
jgi:hypothetical protein